jgi:hypothetical protein
LVYSCRPIKARNYASLALAQQAGIEIKQEVANLQDPAFKESLPFGQVPFLVHGDVKVAQSGAIFRYLARLASKWHSGSVCFGITSFFDVCLHEMLTDMQGDTPEEFALSEMLTEEAVDIFNLMGKAHYSGSRNGSYDELFASGGAFERQCQFLERMFPEGQDFFNAKPTGHKKLAGGIAIASVLDIAVGIHPTCLDATPKLKKFHALLMGTPAFAGIRELGNYYKRDE